MDPLKSYLLLLATAVCLTVCVLATPTLGKSKEVALKPINLPDPSQLLSTLSSKLIKPKPAFISDPKQLLAGLSSKFVKPKPVFVKPVIVKPVIVVKPVLVGGAGGSGHGHGHGHGHHGKNKYISKLKF
ncbi:chorion protein S38 [Drosophila obscura]|uniref:chorion protein S38 n=1 Tax=Drosophila obscura TaxID=7282 RepID=UPI001BB240BD|nr:chorion protein S38 [Drosophila obscura]